MDIGTLTGQIAIEDQLSGVLNTIASRVTTFADRFDDAFAGIAVGAGAAVAAIGGVTAAVIALGNRGSDVNDLSGTLENFAGSAQNASAIMDQLRAGTLNTVNDFDLMQTSTKLLAAGVNLTAENFGTLSQAAFTLQNQGLGPTKDMLGLVSQALLTGRTRALEMKIGKLDLSKAEENFAASLGKTKDQLSEAGKLEARRVGLLAALADRVRQAGSAERDFGEQMEFAVTQIRNWGDELASRIAQSSAVTGAVTAIGAALQQAFGGQTATFMDMVVATIDNFANLVGRVGPVVVQWFGDIAAAAIRIAPAVVNGMSDIQEKIVAVWNWLSDLNERFQITDTIVAAARGAWNLLEQGFYLVQRAIQAVRNAWQEMPAWLQGLTKSGLEAAAVLGIYGLAIGAATTPLSAFIGQIDLGINIVGNFTGAVFNLQSIQWANLPVVGLLATNYANLTKTLQTSTTVMMLHAAASNALNLGTTFLIATFTTLSARIGLTSVAMAASNIATGALTAAKTWLNTTLLALHLNYNILIARLGLSSTVFGAARIAVVATTAAMTALGVAMIAIPLVALGAALWQVAGAFKGLWEAIQAGNVWEFLTAKDSDNWVRRWLGLSNAIETTSTAASEAAIKANLAAEQFQKMKDRLSGVALARDVQQLQMAFSTLKEEGKLTSESMSNVGKSALVLRQQGATLTSELTVLANAEDDAGDAADRLGEDFFKVGKAETAAATAAKQAREEIEKMAATFSGLDKIAATDKILKALDLSVPIGKMTVEIRQGIIAAVQDTIEVFDALGRQAPQDLQAVLSAAGGVTKAMEKTKDFIAQGFKDLAPHVSLPFLEARDVLSKDFVFTVTGVTGTVITKMKEVDFSTQQWIASLGNASQAFANLSQISGGVLGGIAQQIAELTAAMNVGAQAGIALDKGFDNLDDGLDKIEAGGDGAKAGFAQAAAGALQLAAGIAQAIAAMDAATQSSSRMKNALSGAMVGAQIGGAFGGIGAIVGAIGGALFGLGKKAEETGIEAGRRFSMLFNQTVSPALALSLSQIAKSMGGSEYLAGLTRISDLIREAGGVTTQTLNQWLIRTSDLLGAVERGAIDSNTAVRELEQVFPQLAEAALAGNGLASQSFLNVIANVKALGLEVQAVSAFILGQLTVAAEGFNSVAAGMFAPMLDAQQAVEDTSQAAKDQATVLKDLEQTRIGQAKESAKVQKALQALTGAKKKNESDSDFKKRQDEIAKLMQELARLNGELQKTDDEIAKANAEFMKMERAANLAKAELQRLTDGGQVGFDRMGRLAMAQFSALVAEGMSVVAAIDLMGPALDNMVVASEQFGFSAGAAVQELLDIRQFVNDSPAVAGAIDGLNQMLQGLHNSGYMTQAIFTDLGSEAVRVFGEIQAQGLSGDQAMRMMQPTLQTLWQLQQDFGYEVDEATQALLDEATASGVVGAQFQSDEQKQTGALTRIADLIQKLVDALGISGTEAEAMATRGVAAMDALRQNGVRGVRTGVEEVSAAFGTAATDAEGMQSRANTAMRDLDRNGLETVRGGLRGVRTAFVDAGNGAVGFRNVAVPAMVSVHDDGIIKVTDGTADIVGELGNATQAVINFHGTAVPLLRDVEGAATGAATGHSPTGVQEIVTQFGYATEAASEFGTIAQGTLADVEGMAASLGRILGYTVRLTDEMRRKIRGEGWTAEEAAHWIREHADGVEEMANQFEHATDAVKEFGQVAGDVLDGIEVSAADIGRILGRTIRLTDEMRKKIAGEGWNAQQAARWIARREGLEDGDIFGGSAGDGEAVNAFAMPARPGDEGTSVRPATAPAGNGEGGTAGIAGTGFRDVVLRGEFDLTMMDASQAKEAARRILNTQLEMLRSNDGGCLTKLSNILQSAGGR